MMRLLFNYSSIRVLLEDVKGFSVQLVLTIGYFISYLSHLQTIKIGARLILDHPYPAVQKEQRFHFYNQH